MLAETDYSRFCELVEAQTVRQLKRTFDYGKRARKGSGLAELGHWMGRILLDLEAVYGLEDRACAFEIAACEWLARHWGEVRQPVTEVVTVAGQVDKVRLLRLVLDAPPGQRAALATLFAQRYGRAWSWIEKRAAQMSSSAHLDGSDEVETGEPLFRRFLEGLDEIDPLPSTADAAELERVRAESRECEERLRRELAAAADRAERALTRLESLQEELTRMRGAMRAARADGEKLREERSRRIRIERQARAATRELERLKTEYVKLDGRLREMAQRRGPGSAGLDLAALAALDPLQLLGLDDAASEPDLARARRRFAAVFHSDRTAQLPDWVSALFDRLLGIVNDACDRARR